MSVIRHGDIGTPEGHKRGDYIKDVVNGTLIARVRRVSACHALHSLKLLTQNQFDASEKLRTHRELGLGRNSCEYREPTDGGGHTSESERQLIYQDLYKKAIKHLPDYERPLIIHIVIDDNSPTTKYMSGGKKRSRLKKLKQSLDKLARHYGFV